ncbi:MAG: hypothetical protein ACO1PI_05500 [Bacteroidota bacterium]
MLLNAKLKLLERLNNESPNKEQLLYVLAPSNLKEAILFILDLRTKGVIADEFYADQIENYYKRKGIQLSYGDLEIYKVEGYGNYNIDPTIGLLDGDEV